MARPPGTDSTTNLVNLTPQDTTIASMRALTMPASIPSTTRVPDSAETQAWRISATLTLFKLETDSDFHLVLSDASGATMISEIPSPSCDAGRPALPAENTSVPTQRADPRQVSRIATRPRLDSLSW